MRGAMVAVAGLLASCGGNPAARTTAAGTFGGQCDVAPTPASTTPRLVVDAHHDGVVTAAAFSTDGTLATASNDGTVRLWDTATHSLLRVLRGDRSEFSIRDLSWNEDGSALLLQSTHSELWRPDGSQIALPGPNGPRLIAMLPGGGPARFLAHHDDALVWLDDGFAIRGQLTPPDGWRVEELLVPRDRARAVAIASSATSGFAVISWDLASPRSAPHLVPFEGSMYAWPSVSPDGESVIVGVADGDVYRVDRLSTVSASDARTLVERSRPPEWDEDWTLPIVVVSADHSSLAVATEDQVSVIDARTGARSLRVTVDDASVSLDDSGALVAIESDDGAGVWDVRAARLLWRSWSSPIAFSPDGDYLVADDLGDIVLLDARAGLRRGTLGHRVAHPTAAAFIGDDHVAVYASTGTMSVWSLDQASIVSTIDADGEVIGIDHTPNGELVVARAIVDSTSCDAGRDELVVDVFDATRPPPPAALPALGAWPPPAGTRVAYCVPRLDDAPAFNGATGRLVVPAPNRDDDALAIYELATGATIVLASSADQFETTLSGDGRWVGATDFDGDASVWSSQSGELIARVRLRDRHNLRATASAEAMAFSPNGDALAVGGGATAAIYALPAGSLRASIDVGASVHSGDLAFSPNGNLIVTAGDRFAVYTATGRRVFASGGLDRIGGRAAFSRDGERILTLPAPADPIAVVSIWDPHTASPLASLIEFEDGEHGAFTRQGAYAGTAEVGERLGWVFDDPAEWFAFSRFYPLLGTADHVRRRLRGGDDIKGPLHRPPQLAVANSGGSTTRDPRARLMVSAQSAAWVDSVQASVGGRVVAARALCTPSGQVELDVPLEAGDNRITIVAYDGDGVSSNPSVVLVTRD